MDPIQAQAANLVSAVQALLVRQGAAIEGSALMALLGQDVEVLFQALTQGGGVQLRFPSGQTVIAQGELPYPEGTQLRVRILPAATGEVGLRLQVQEARPPSPPAVLSPLIQGEAVSLAARLAQESPPPELVPLVRLLSVLSDAPPRTAALPSSERIQETLRELPGALLSSLGRTLGTGSMASIKELATALQTFVLEFQKAPQVAVSEAPDQQVSPGQDIQTLVQQVLARFQTLASRQPEVPASDRDPLANMIRSLLQMGVEEATSPTGRTTTLPEARTQPEARTGTTVPADSLTPPKLLTALRSHTGSKAELPESWESWIRGSVATLSSPTASPQEAPFHALQAKEGTAFFEIPLPWAQASPLQLWVESDAPEEQQGGHDATKRVLLGMKFSNIGEIRLGMAQGAFGLQIRIWTERPEILEAERERMKQELEDLGKPVDLKIYALTYGPDGTIPTVRSLVVGPSLSALG